MKLLLAAALALSLGACASSGLPPKPTPFPEPTSPVAKAPDFFGVQKKLGALPPISDSNGIKGWFTKLEDLVLNVPGLTQAAALANAAQPKPDRTAAQCFTGLIPVRAQVDALLASIAIPPLPDQNTPLAVAFEELRLAKMGAGSAVLGIKSQIDDIRTAVNNACGALFVDTNAGIMDPLSLFTGS